MLRPTLTANLSSVDAGTLLGILEASGSSGTVRYAGDYLRLRKGRIVKASREATLVVADMLRGIGDATFRAVLGEPTGELSLSIQGTLLECTRIIDESTK